MLRSRVRRSARVFGAISNVAPPARVGVMPPAFSVTIHLGPQESAGRDHIGVEVRCTWCHATALGSDPQRPQIGCALPARRCDSSIVFRRQPSSTDSPLESAASRRRCRLGLPLVPYRAGVAVELADVRAPPPPADRLRNTCRRLLISARSSGAATAPTLSPCRREERWHTVQWLGALQRDSQCDRNPARVAWTASTRPDRLRAAARATDSSGESPPSSRPDPTPHVRPLYLLTSTRRPSPRCRSPPCRPRSLIRAASLPGSWPSRRAASITAALSPPRRCCHPSPTSCLASRSKASAAAAVSTLVRRAGASARRRPLPQLRSGHRVVIRPVCCPGSDRRGQSPRWRPAGRALACAPESGDGPDARTWRRGAGGV